MTIIDTFDGMDWSTIEGFINQGQEEHLHLDFKLVGNSELNRKDDKRNFATAVSGFANSSGGIIIWGVDARKNADGIDCATAVVDLVNPALMVTRLNTLSGDVTSPIVDGLRHRQILRPNATTGVVASLVPESDGGPYMAKLGEQRYYKRSGDSFYQMEHFDLEDMFGRRRKPSLKLTYGYKETGNVEEISFRIENIGRAAAKHAGLMAEFENIKLLGVDRSLVDISSINPKPMVQYDNHVGVIHANGVPILLGTVRFERLDPDANVVVRVTMYCDGIQTIRRSDEF